MNSLNQLGDGPVQCNCSTNSQASVDPSRRKEHRQFRYQSSWNRDIFQQVIWVLVISCCMAPMQCQDTATTTVDTLLTTSLSTTPSPVPFNVVDCILAVKNKAQRQYVCYDHPKLFYILQYAENISRHICEEHFTHEMWNCSEFSLINEPKISKGSLNINKELAYVNALSLAAVALSVGQACSSHYGHYDVLCECEEGVECMDNLTYAVQVAETFLTKRYQGQPVNSKLNLIHRNFAAAKQHIEELVDKTDENCKCHGVSGSCTVRTCNSPELPSFREVANSIRKAYLNACKVVSKGTSRISWVSDCNREIKNNDILYTVPQGWCKVDPTIGALGTAGRECSINANATNSCQRLCTACGLSYQEHQQEVVSSCDCKFEFCCRIKCEECRGIRTYYACST